MNCKNCGNVISGDFCDQCGQKASVKRISLNNLMNDLSESIFQIDKGFLFTFRELFIRPGDSIREYLSGQRIKHYRPISYLLVLSTVYFLITNITKQNTWINDAIIGFTNGASDTSKEIVIPSIIAWFADNYAYSTLLLIPIFSLASYICFKKYDANYFEHIVLNSYITGQQAIFYSLFALLNAIVKSEFIESIPFFISTLYCIMVYIHFFRGKGRGSIVLRSICTYLLHFVISVFILAIVLGVQGVL